MPLQPTNPPTITAVTQTSVSVTLTPIPLGDNGGSAVTGYILLIDDGLGGSFTQVQDSLSTSIIISNLKTGRSYRLKYAGHNVIYDQGNMFSCDSLQFSHESIALTAIGPDAPTNLRMDHSLRYATQVVV